MFSCSQKSFGNDVFEYVLRLLRSIFLAHAYPEQIKFCMMDPAGEVQMEVTRQRADLLITLQAMVDRFKAS